MANIFKTKQGIGVRWDSSDWMKGLLPDYNSSAGTGTRIGDGFLLETAINPYRNPYYLRPGYLGADATNVSVVDAVLKNWVVNGSSAYASSGGAKLFQITIATATPSVSNAGAWPHTITPHGGHTTVVGEDVAIYYLNGTKYLFYSWNDNTDGDVGRYDLSATFDDDYTSTVPTGMAVLDKDFPHPMIVGDDNVLYIADGNNLASLDGNGSANGVYNSSALDLPNDYVITSFAKTSDYLVIYAYKVSDSSGSQTYQTGEATAFFWDYLSPTFTYAFPLEGGYVNGGFNLGSVPGCFTQGQTGDIVSGHQSKLLLFTGSEFETKLTFTGNIPGRGGVDTSGQSILWNSAGTIFQYGSPFIGLPGGLNRTLTGGGTTNEGLLKAMTINSTTSELIASSGTTTSGGLQYFSGNFVFSAAATTGFKQLPPSERNRWKVDYVRINYFNVTSTGRAFSLSLVTDNNNATADQRGLTTTIIDSGTDSAVISSISNIYDLDTSGNALPTVSTSLALQMTWGGETPAVATDAVGVESVEVYLIPTPVAES